MNRLAVRIVLVSVFLAPAVPAGCAAKPPLPPPPPPADILQGPYVTGVTENSAYVLWVTDPNAGASSLQAANPQQLESIPVKIDLKAGPVLPDQAEVLHTAVLTGMSPGQTYLYTVKDSRGSTSGSFRTAPARDSNALVRFVVYGDTRSYPDRHRLVALAMEKDLPFAFVLNSGDLVANGMIWELWKREFFDPAKELFAAAPLWPVRGNHEMDAVTYTALFPGLANGGLYYSFDYGQSHFVVLDSGDEEEAPDANQVAWLEKDLAASKARWKFAIYHKPSVDVGSHGSRWGREEVWPILQKYGVDMIFSGHSHVYERFRPIGEKGRKPIIQIVTGGGGAPSYEVSPSPALEVGYSGLHHCVVEVAGDTLRMVAKTPDGNVIDRVEIRKTAGGLFDANTMDRAMPTQEAWDVANVLTGFGSDFAEEPAAGAPCALKVPQWPFPVGSSVRIEPLAENPWSIQPLQFRPEANGGPLSLAMTAPGRFGLAEKGRGFSPPVRVKLTVDHLGKSYTRDDLPISAAFAAIRRFTPEPPASAVARAKGPIAVDGDLKDWEGAAFLALPSKNAPGKIARFAWGPEGLYGALLVPDANVKGDPKNPLAGDVIELFLDARHRRGQNATRDSACMKFEVFPLPQGGEGKGASHASYGRLKDQRDIFPVAWKRTPGGYALEFLIPAGALAPAAMEKGTVLGFHYVLHDDGRAVEQFVSTRGRASVWTTPLYWGAVVLE